MNDFTDRLLDAGLKEYSRVPAPEGFAVRRPRPRGNWGWLLVPVAAASAMAMIAVSMRPAPLPSAPGRMVATANVPVMHKPAPVKKNRPEGLFYCHTLTAVEIASLEIPAELLAPRAETPITDLVIKPLESANPTEKE